MIDVRHHLAALIALVVRLVEPAPPPRTPLVFARTLQITEGADAPGADRAPVHLGDKPHRAQEAALRWALRFRRFVVLAPPQDGKDTAVAVPLVLWSLIEYRRPVAYATPDKHLGAKLYRAKVRAPLLASGYGWALPDDGPGSTSGTPDDILFQTGARYYQLGAGASNGAGQSGITTWLVVVTEADKFRTAQLTWIEDRNKGYPDDRRTVLVGTLDRYDGKGLWAEREYSCKGSMHYPCLSCGHWQTFEWKAFSYDAAAHAAPINGQPGNDTARLTCPGCQRQFTEADRQVMLERGVEVFEGQTIDDNGQVVGQPTPAETGSLRWTAFDSPRRRLANMAAEHRDAAAMFERTGDDSRLREFFLKECVMPPDDRTQALYVREVDLAQRSALSIYRRREVPAGMDFVIVTVDVQLRRVLWTAIAFHIASERWCIVDYGSEAVCGDSEEPTRLQRWAAFDRVQARAVTGWPRPDGFLCKAVAGGIDTGDGNTRDEVLGWLRQRPGWFALKGTADRVTSDHAAGEAIFRLPGVLTVRRQTKTATAHDLFEINVDSIKAKVYRALTYKPDAPGAGQLPQGEASDGQLIRQLCAERQEMSDAGPVWVQRYRHNHYLDTTVYAVALFLYLIHLRTLRTSGGDAAGFARSLGST